MIQKACESYFIWNCLFIWICWAKFEDTTNNPNPPMNFSWIKENEIAASGGPKNFENLKWIENQGIKHVLSLDQVSLHFRVSSPPGESPALLIEDKTHCPDTRSLNS